VLGLGLVLGLI